MNFQIFPSLLVIIVMGVICNDIPDGFTLKQESTHFKIFTQQEDGSVPDIIKRAEEIFPQASQHLNYTPTEKINLFIFPSIQLFHHHFNMLQAPSFLTSRTQNGNVFIVSPTNAGPYHTFETLINRLGGAIVRALVERISKATKLPYWFATGFGLYEAFNGKIIDLYVNELKTAITNNQLPSFEQLAQPSHPMASICAYSLVEFLIQQRGMAVIPRLIRDFSTFETVTGLSQEAFYTQWLTYVKKQYS